MSQMKVDTNLVGSAAKALEMMNGQLRDDFSKVQQAMNRLSNSWEGAAATDSIREFNEMRMRYTNPRYDVISGFVQFMYNQVGLGYEQAEQLNTSLADAFK